MEICNKKECTGCSACKNICPKDCIKLEEDEYGFIYPTIDKTKCINCNLCKNTCPNNKKIEYKTKNMAYAAFSTNNKIRNNSTSGGIASQLITNIIKTGGIAYCATFDDNLKVIHKRIDNINMLYKASESKYVQSYINETYRELKKDLIKGKQVLFIGTPCQVNGLNEYLKKEYENLYTIDILCHGVPSQKLLQDQLQISKKEGFKVDKIRFRKNNKYQFELLSNNEVVLTQKDNENYFITGFQKSLFLRESCFECKYKTKERCSDLTIGDFWGLKDINIEISQRQKGVSVLLVNSNKGNTLIKEYGDNIELIKEPIKDAIEGNRPLRENSKIPSKYYKFRKLYSKYGYLKACRKTIKRDIILSKIKRAIINH